MWSRACHVVVIKSSCVAFRAIIGLEEYREDGSRDPLTNHVTGGWYSGTVHTVLHTLIADPCYLHPPVTLWTESSPPNTYSPLSLPSLSSDPPTSLSLQTQPSSLSPDRCPNFPVLFVYLYRCWLLWLTSSLASPAVMLNVSALQGNTRDRRWLMIEVIIKRLL